MHVHMYTRAIKIEYDDNNNDDNGSNNNDDIDNDNDSSTMNIIITTIITITATVIAPYNAIWKYTAYINKQRSK